MYTERPLIPKPPRNCISISHNKILGEGEGVAASGNKNKREIKSGRKGFSTSGWETGGLKVLVTLLLAVEFKGLGLLDVQVPFSHHDRPPLVYHDLSSMNLIPFESFLFLWSLLHLAVKLEHKNNRLQTAEVKVSLCDTVYSCSIKMVKMVPSHCIL